tara:strand:- start:6833 stop:7072 length:240 start_codon:yes stop_codon:yes gene_type:complete
MAKFLTAAEKASGGILAGFGVPVAAGLLASRQYENTEAGPIGEAVKAAAKRGPTESGIPLYGLGAGLLFNEEEGEPELY